MKKINDLLIKKITETSAIKTFLRGATYLSATAIIANGGIAAAQERTTTGSPAKISDGSNMGGAFNANDWIKLGDSHNIDLDAAAGVSYVNCNTNNTTLTVNDNANLGGVIDLAGGGAGSITFGGDYRLNLYDGTGGAVGDAFKALDHIDFNGKNGVVAIVIDGLSLPEIKNTGGGGGGTINVNGDSTVAKISDNVAVNFTADKTLTLTNASTTGAITGGTGTVEANENLTVNGASDFKTLNLAGANTVTALGNFQIATFTPGHADSILKIGDNAGNEGNKTIVITNAVGVAGGHGQLHVYTRKNTVTAQLGNGGNPFGTVELHNNRRNVNEWQNAAFATEVDKITQLQTEIDPAQHANKIQLTIANIANNAPIFIKGTGANILTKHNADTFDVADDIKFEQPGIIVFKGNTTFTQNGKAIDINNQDNATVVFDVSGGDITFNRADAGAAFVNTGGNDDKGILVVKGGTNTLSFGGNIAAGSSISTKALNKVYILDDRTGLDLGTDRLLSAKDIIFNHANALLKAKSNGAAVNIKGDIIPTGDGEGQLYLNANNVGDLTVEGQVGSNVLAAITRLNKLTTASANGKKVHFSDVGNVAYIKELSIAGDTQFDGGLNTIDGAGDNGSINFKADKTLTLGAANASTTGAITGGTGTVQANHNLAVNGNSVFKTLKIATTKTATINGNLTTTIDCAGVDNGTANIKGNLTGDSTFGDTANITVTGKADGNVTAGNNSRGSFGSTAGVTTFGDNATITVTGNAGGNVNAGDNSKANITGAVTGDIGFGTDATITVGGVVGGNVNAGNSSRANIGGTVVGDIIFGTNANITVTNVGGGVKVGDNSTGSFGSITGNVDFGTDATITVGGLAGGDVTAGNNAIISIGEVGGNITTGNNSTLSLTGHNKTLSKDINGNGVDQLTLNITNKYTIDSNIGNTHRLKKVSISGNDVAFNAGKTFNTKDLEISGDNTVFNNEITVTNDLGISGDNTDFKGKINANKIILKADKTVTINDPTSVITNGIESNGNDQGTLYYKGNDYALDYNVGGAGAKVNTIKIDDKTLTVNAGKSIYATNILPNANANENGKFVSNSDNLDIGTIGNATDKFKDVELNCNTDNVQYNVYSKNLELKQRFKLAGTKTMQVENVVLSHANSHFVHNSKSNMTIINIEGRNTNGVVEFDNTDTTVDFEIKSMKDVVFGSGKYTLNQSIDTASSKIHGGNLEFKEGVNYKLGTVGADDKSTLTLNKSQPSFDSITSLGGVNINALIYKQGNDIKVGKIDLANASNINKLTVNLKTDKKVSIPSDIKLAFAPGGKISSAAIEVKDDRNFIKWVFDPVTGQLQAAKDEEKIEEKKKQINDNPEITGRAKDFINKAFEKNVDDDPKLETSGTWKETVRLVNNKETVDETAQRNLTVENVNKVAGNLIENNVGTISDQLTARMDDVMPEIELPAQEFDIPSAEVPEVDTQSDMDYGQPNVGYSAAAAAAGDEDVGRSKVGVWTNAFTGFGKQEKYDAHSGYKSRLNGVVLGFDIKSSPKLLLGTAVLMANNRINHLDAFKGNKTKSNIKVLSLYSMYNFTPSAFMRTNFAYGMGKINTLRYVITNVDEYEQAKGEIPNRFFSAESAFGFNKRLGSCRITPTFGIRFSRFNQGAYTEKGASNFNQHLNSITSSKFYFLAGLSLSTTKNIKDIFITPRIGVNFSKSIFSDRPVLEYRIGDMPEAKTTPKGSKYNTQVGINGSLSIRKNSFEGIIKGDLQKGHKYRAVGGALTLKVNV